MFSKEKKILLCTANTSYMAGFKLKTNQQFATVCFGCYYLGMAFHIGRQGKYRREIRTGLSVFRDRFLSVCQDKNLSV